MPATVPTTTDHQALTTRVDALTERLQRAEDALAAATRPPTHVLRPEDYGAMAGRDCTDAFRRMLDAVDRGLQRDPGGGVPVARHTIALGPGPYILSRPWMTAETGRAQGLTIRGIGKRSTEIVWTGEGPLLTNNDRWMGVRWHDVSFRSTNPRGAFLYSYSTGACQDWAFFNCEWRGSWHYGIGLDGPETSNCNSEWRFDGCHINGSYRKAWLWSGMTPSIPQQDQFLNFWLTACKAEYDHGDLLRFDRGGHINIDGGSYIIKSQKPDGEKSRFFHFPTASHADAVRTLNVRGVRFELRNTASQVIYSAWRGGNITFDGCTDTALGFKPFSNDLIAHEYDVTRGAPQIRYEQCDLVGRHAYHVGTTPGRGGVTYAQCTRKNNRTRGSFLVTGTGASLTTSVLPITHQDDGDRIH